MAFRRANRDRARRSGSSAPSSASRRSPGRIVRFAGRAASGRRSRRRNRRRADAAGLCLPGSARKGRSADWRAIAGSRPAPAARHRCPASPAGRARRCARAAGLISVIHLPMKSPEESGPCASSAKARMPPQRPWPSTTICSTLSACTAYSSAAEVPWSWSSGEKGGTRLATLRTTNISPGRASKITSGETRESQQPISMIFGVWPLSASSS